RDLIKPPASPLGWGNNTAADVLVLAEETLEARIAWAERRYDDAIQHLEKAVAKEDALVYDEPPQWLFPVRQSLGGAYLARGEYEKARVAFSDELAIHRDNGRSLYGLSSALQHLGDKEAAARFRALYRDAWSSSDEVVRELDDDVLWLLGMEAPPRGESAPAPGR
ncbi:MAG TPA: hypothetical protein VN923_05105, partial [Thermoanaerobaculia bacterium]|nr:hypothetical protein [Thermoanaerobaculia bacterium]